MTHINLFAETSGWVRIENAGARGFSAKAAAFLNANARHMHRVGFGHGPQPSLGIQADRVAAFIAHAARSGLTAAYAKA